MTSYDTPVETPDLNIVMNTATSCKATPFLTSPSCWLPKLFCFFWTVLALSSCAPVPRAVDSLPAVYMGDDADRSELTELAPLFLVEHPEIEYNRIGTPAVRENSGGEKEVFIDPDRATIYAEQREFVSQRGNRYTNFIYRVHFPEIPSFLLPFQISAGRNIGLFVIVTLNEDGQPLLYTTVQTCGCYLAFIPTSYLREDAFPSNWNRKRQRVYGQTLPGLVKFDEAEPVTRPLVVLADISHRVKDFRLAGPDESGSHVVKKAGMCPLSELEQIIAPTGQTVSLYETSGPRKGYVRNSRKIWERLLISWWAIDWRVGEDKKLGHKGDDAPLFYTSLKPWDRQESDMRDFATFLAYWGWRL